MYFTIHVLFFVILILVCLSLYLYQVLFIYATDEPLTLSAVYLHLKQVSSKWDDIGRELGVSLDFRKSLKQDCSITSDNARLESILDKWIQSKGNSVSWEALIEILKELQLVKIAQQIEAKLLVVEGIISLKHYYHFLEPHMYYHCRNNNFVDTKTFDY